MGKEVEMKSKFTEWLQGRIKNKKFMEQLVPPAGQPRPTGKVEIPRKGEPFVGINVNDTDVIKAYQAYFDRYAKNYLLENVEIKRIETSGYQTEKIITSEKSRRYSNIYSFFLDRGYYVLFNPKPEDGDKRPEIFIVQSEDKLPPNKIIAKYGKYPIRLKDNSETAFTIGIMELHEALFGSGIVWSQVTPRSKPFVHMTDEQYSSPLKADQLYFLNYYLDIDNDPQDREEYKKLIQAGKVVIMPGRPPRPSGSNR